MLTGLFLHLLRLLHLLRWHLLDLLVTNLRRDAHYNSFTEVDISHTLRYLIHLRHLALRLSILLSANKLLLRKLSIHVSLLLCRHYLLLKLIIRYRFPLLCILTVSAHLVLAHHSL